MNDNWEQILISWIIEAENLKDFERANGMRATFNMLKLIDIKNNLN